MNTTAEPPAERPAEPPAEPTAKTHRRTWLIVGTAAVGTAVVGIGVIALSNKHVKIALPGDAWTVPQALQPLSWLTGVNLHTQS
jgi:hypothetical protein